MTQARHLLITRARRICCNATSERKSNLSGCADAQSYDSGTVVSRLSRHDSLAPASGTTNGSLGSCIRTVSLTRIACPGTHAISFNSRPSKQTKLRYYTWSRL
ncbi:hypothetical protein PENSPDRAFT_317233 [Peniophora sp. CONT]|nr:hypothetical protein PENSPDRAFT_328620 [Peniophora sp. CONT]KZV60746.1 hypothetical protein PENSPDRAFT_328761 [Peniophora sp. CONT]KZV60995.1 hypothetical protein PENSPDRAFT_317233 [Peniophora sp. CONT]